MIILFRIISNLFLMGYHKENIINCISNTKHLLYFTSSHASVRKGNAANPKVLRSKTFPT